MTAQANSAPDFRTIPLTRGMVAKVDVADFDWLNQWAWYACGSGGRFYAARTDGRGHERYQVRMHRLIVDASKAQEVDHVNRDTLDNRRSNLRFADHSQNSANRRSRPTKSGFRGVHAQKNGRWTATAACRGVRHCAGTFDTPHQAAAAYDMLAIRLFGPFALLNFPPSQ